MKKTFLSVLIIAITLTMLSSCVYIKDTQFDITCYNDTFRTVTDWCVKKGKSRTYANDDHNCKIRSNESDTIHDLDIGEYKLYFTFVDRFRLEEDDYSSSGNIWLDEDVTFYISDKSFYSNRSAVSDAEEKDAELYLICSNGQEIPLVKVEQQNRLIMLFVVILPWEKKTSELARS